MQERKGWIKLYRQILECDIWIGFDNEEVEPFDKRSAWIDLLLRANHSDKEILFNGKPITVTRGQLMTSVRKLAKRWGWSVKKTYSFLGLLVSLGMVIKESDYNKTLLTIVNYEVYQGDGNTEETEKKHERNTKETESRHKQEDISNKTDISNKNDNKYIVEIVDYLNLVCHTNYKANTKNTIKHISARLKEGYAVDDFKTVIDKKANEWLGNSMEQYLRPDTLFGTKFESYLNQNIVRESKDGKSAYMDAINNRVSQVDSWV